MLSVPIWLIGALTPIQLLPGLPVSLLMAFCPMIAASILVYREGKTTGIAGLFKKAFGWGLFPNQDSHYDPLIIGLITAFAAVIVTVFWGPRTLIRKRTA